MASYWIFEPPGTDAGSLEATTEAVVVRDGWSWSAALFGPLWALARGLWLVTLLWLAVTVGLAVAAAAYPIAGFLAAPAVLLFLFWFGLEANALRAWTLRRRGYVPVGIAVGRNGREAEERYLLARRPASSPVPPPAADRRDPALAFVTPPLAGEPPSLPKASLPFPSLDPVEPLLPFPPATPPAKAT